MPPEGGSRAGVGGKGPDGRDRPDPSLRERVTHRFTAARARDGNPLGFRQPLDGQVGGRIEAGPTVAGFRDGWLPPCGGPLCHVAARALATRAVKAG